MMAAIVSSRKRAFSISAAVGPGAGLVVAFGAVVGRRAFQPAEEALPLACFPNSRDRLQRPASGRPAVCDGCSIEQEARLRTSSVVGGRTLP